MKLRLRKVEWHSLLTPVILLFQLVTESKEQQIKQWLTWKKRNTSSLTNQEFLFPKSESDYFAACLKTFNGFLMPKEKKKKIQIPLGSIRGPLCAMRSGLSLPLQPYFSKPLSCSFYPVWNSEILQMLWLFCAHALAQVNCFLWKVHLPKLSFPPSNSIDQLILKDRFSSKATPLGPSFLLAFRDPL